MKKEEQQDLLFLLQHGENRFQKIWKMQQHLLLRKYDGFMKKGRVRFRGRQATQGF